MIDFYLISMLRIVYDLFIFQSNLISQKYVCIFESWLLQKEKNIVNISGTILAEGLFFTVPVHDVRCHSFKNLV